MRLQFKYKNNNYLWLGEKSFMFVTGDNRLSFQVVSDEMVDVLYDYVMKNFNKETV